MPSKLDAPPAGPGSPLSLRVGFVGERALEWLGGWVDAVAVETGDAPLAGAGGRLDALVVDSHPEGVDRPEAKRLVEEARDSGARVIGLPAHGGPGQREGHGGGEAPVWAGLDPALGEPGDDGARARAGVQPIDSRVFNPLGFRHTDVAGLAGALTAPGRELARALAFIAEAAPEEPVTLFSPPRTVSHDLPAGVLASSTPKGGPAALCAALKERLGALDHPSFHASEAERAAHLVRLCASGVPVLAAEVSDRLALMLGEELCGALADVSVSDLLDLDLRERVSVAQRRAALRNHSLDARWRALADAVGLAVPERPKVSVILSTRRQEWLPFGLSQVRRQNYEPRELVLCLHGDDFSDDVEARLRDEVEGPLEIVHVRSELTLGDALNAGVEVASGEFVTKMDDDDYYSVDHLWDLVLASEYSGADLVGKAAEFVYLEEIDVTIRQLTKDVETRLAGGGMMARRGPLRELGGWPTLSRGEDLAIVRRYEENGRTIHRTHPHGYILNRHGRDHTWRPYVDYFLFRSGRQWRGLRFDQTGIR